MKNMKGIFPALLTPLTSDGKINDKSYEALIEMQISAGINGLYIGGSSAEGVMMSLEERKHIIDIVSETVNKRVPVISHVGSISTCDAVELARYSEEKGLDAISSVAPYYYKFLPNEIIDYYRDIVASSSLPMIVYNVPGLSGVAMSESVIDELFSDERVIGMKFTSSDFFAMQKVKSKYPDKLIYNGFDEMLLSGLCVGADGGIGTTYNFMPGKFVRLYKLVAENKLAEALEVQDEINKIVSVILDISVISGTKEVLNQLGIECGSGKKPFKTVSEAEKQMIKEKILPFI